ncbi:glycosyltransferase [Saccharicrinis fermentans]|uniref:D-inositol-3-phosphate glycosyltransferase n=1 Tax=Saccharicrinis fermentans DSM 9555 = JCM 21142 TaxID=869213 RepID=W7YIZ2_9BACT|nr:glycosyltransferase [Saccharicrinis fermentans]GAF04446.1 D-inositol-3-phosphate glycosyltransferase [Saccharicrinis fermentans DSM 9555 = JCM 21142]
MKVLIINKSTSNGGAAVAAYRLFNALKESGTDVKMLVEESSEGFNQVESIAHSKKEKKKAFRRFVKERLCFLPYEKNKKVRFKFSPASSGIDISKHPLVQEADIIHLHWVNQGFLSLKSLEKLFKLNKKIVWTLHDMWPFTGGCHYAGDCENFMNGCGKCQFLRNSGKKDLSHRILQRKKKLWNTTQMNAVGCSQWMEKAAKDSTLLQNHPVINIPNPIDPSVFCSLDKQQCRQEFDLPQKKKLLLFGAANINDPRKGFKQLIQALEFMDVRHPHLVKELELVTFGDCKSQAINKLPYKWHKIDFISDQNKIANLYNCADAFALPSMEDNLPNTAMESLACGVPVVAFNTGGVPEMIKHKETGYLATANNCDDFGMGIYHLLYENNADYMKYATTAFAKEKYANNTVAKQYNELYTSLVS